jgi:hypothetical protein
LRALLPRRLCVLILGANTDRIDSALPSQDKVTSAMAIDPELLEKFARKYVWWKTAKEAMAHQDRIVIQVMNLGDYEDVQALVHRVDSAYLRKILTGAEAGQFDARSWTYWHYRLGLSDPGKVPALPERKVS